MLEIHTIDTEFLFRNKDNLFFFFMSSNEFSFFGGIFPIKKTTETIFVPKKYSRDFRLFSICSQDGAIHFCNYLCATR